MSANLLEIAGRNRRDPLGMVSPADFEFAEGPAIDAAIVLTNPRVSLYCLDHSERRALFVETNPEADLSQAPFLFQAQYENAIRLIRVPYETIHALASGIELEGHRLIFIHSVGRSGSTLMGAALNAVPGVTTLSEPDVFTQLVALRGWDRSNEAEIGALVESCLKLSCKATLGDSNPAVWAIKPRSFGIEIADLVFARFPDARNLFLYRHAETYLASALRAFVNVDEGNIEFRAGIQAWFSTLVPLVGKHARENGSILTVAAIGAMVWLSTMERFVELTGKGFPALAVRYEDLKAAPAETLQKILEYCELPLSSMGAVQQVLKQDSQAGSAVARDRLEGKKFQLSDAHRADLARLLAAHPTIKSPDFVAPGTMQRDSAPS